MPTRHPLPLDQYQVGVICALDHELAAAKAILDEFYDNTTAPDILDTNTYILGRLHKHNVVITCLPAGVYGTSSAARVVRDMARTFTGLRFGLMVGIGGGIPNLSKGLDIRLGDVVISQPDQTYGGVVQYDLGKLGNEHFERKGFLKPPPNLLLSALGLLKADRHFNNSQVPDILTKIYKQHPSLTKNGFGFPRQENDTLYCSSCDGSTSGSCEFCTDGKIKRDIRENHNPAFWYGTIASGNKLIRDAIARDTLGHELGALCVEMEAAGLMNDFPCIVIRGICDYSDSHKNDTWQKYAALAAAAYAKELLAYISPEQTSRAAPIQKRIDSLERQSHLMEEHLREIRRQNEKQEQRYQSEQARQCHQVFKTSTYEKFKAINSDRVEGTCQWVLSHSQYIQWNAKDHDDLLWISANPGCGKSVLAKSLIDNELRATNQHTVCYFFFKDNEEQDRLATALCALLHQLFSHQPQLIQYAISVWNRTGDKLIKEVPELWRILLAAARSDVVHDVTCVLDALDECQLPDQHLLINMLAQFYTSTSRSSPRIRQGRLKFLITSRPYDNIRAEFQKTLNDLPTIQLRGEEENDRIHRENDRIHREIDLVVREQVARVAANLKLDDHTKDQLEAKLLKMEHRTYLWLYLAIGDIYQTFRNSWRPEEAPIESLPSTVEDAYEKVLTRVDEKQRDKVKEILLIVIGARRPLTIQEMALALGIAITTHSRPISKARFDPDHLGNQICQWCGLFIFINHSRIYLIHQTAKEFLICNSSSINLPSGWKHCLGRQEIEEEMTRISISFLCLKDVWSTGKALVQKFKQADYIDDVLDEDNAIESLLVYTAKHWPDHFRDAKLPMNEYVTAQISQLYDINSTPHRLWFAIFWKIEHLFDGEPPVMNPVCLAAVLGHAEVLEWLLESDQHYNINESNTTGETALIWASEHGHDEAVQTLLNREADVNAPGVTHENALIAALYHGHQKVVEILLDKEVDVNTPGGIRGNALTAASYHGHQKIVEILLDKGANVNAQGGIHENALIAASYHSHQKVMQILLDRGADVNAPEAVHGNALIAASHHGRQKVVEILLDGGADINAPGGLHGNALMTATYSNEQKIVEILLSKGADVNAQGGLHGNALFVATFRRYPKIVEILLDNGADPNGPGGIFYHSALQVASVRGFDEIVEILLDKGADPGLEDSTSSASDRERG
ncbi:MAG: hypothetical protein M1822_009623 [Bathelium mastoideum]|nr:MAG: hypothetical protein M1822_009623 [Bathelium mastoideum]